MGRRTLLGSKGIRTTFNRQNVHMKKKLLRITAHALLKVSWWMV